MLEPPATTHRLSTLRLVMLSPIVALLLGGCAAESLRHELTLNEANHAMALALLASSDKSPYCLLVSGKPPPAPLVRKLRNAGHRIAPCDGAGTLNNVYIKRVTDEQVVVVVNRSGALWAVDHTLTLERRGSRYFRILSHDVVELET